MKGGSNPSLIKPHLAPSSFSEIMKLRPFKTTKSDSNSKLVDSDSNGRKLNIDSKGSKYDIDSNGKDINSASTSDPNNAMKVLFETKLALKPIVSRGLVLSKDKFVDSNGDMNSDCVDIAVKTQCKM